MDALALISTSCVSDAGASRMFPMTFTPKWYNVLNGSLVTRYVSTAWNGLAFVLSAKNNPEDIVSLLSNYLKYDLDLYFH